MLLPNEIILTSADFRKLGKMPSYEQMRKARLRRDEELAFDLCWGTRSQRAVKEYNSLLGKGA